MTAITSTASMSSIVSMSSTASRSDDFGTDRSRERTSRDGWRCQYFVKANAFLCGLRASALTEKRIHSTQRRRERGEKPERKIQCLTNDDMSSR